MNEAKVEEIPVPPQALIAQALPRVDYRDAYRIPWPQELDLDIIAFVRLIFTSAPSWVTKLTLWRNRIVKLFGIKVPDNLSVNTPLNFSFEPGTSASFFRVYERRTNELLLGEDDRHLDFRLSFLMEERDGVHYAVVATVVQFHGRAGRVYFLPVRPFHRLMVPAMLRSAVRNF
ncbi:DUF2867 domain-containing protein [Heliobacterium chlorum]|uniref:DUF2867 domain-containing protein n=1 Tax=Heliobacterium chlorum TaxID=2698 RepID=A0ABR7T5E8_HELCL|nr:DUF2867 domain-containing protein [Heliobacterium chlorum]MBC9785595.1 DUF2867 domain-containing protein [Heliobacterium chlorum]